MGLAFLLGKTIIATKPLKNGAIELELEDRCGCRLTVRVRPVIQGFPGGLAHDPPAVYHVLTTYKSVRVVEETEVPL